MNTFERLARALSPRYRLEQPIDCGLAAQVYLADDTVCTRRVAIKVLRREMAASTNDDRFRAEIRVAAQLQHPNIVAVYGSGEIDGLPFYVMPYIDGESLRARLNRMRRLSIDEALCIAADIARALRFAHRRHVLHRDIKPENIMLRDGRAILLDFGIALSLDGTVMPRRTSPGMAVGTCEYMSPEQVAGERTIDGRSDIYSLACVIYEMLCGRPPFIGVPSAVMNGHRTARPRALVARCPDIPRPISRVLARALAKAPAARFGTPAEFLAALRDASLGQRPERPRVAVLPFASTHPGNAMGELSDLLTERVVYALTDIGVEVAARSALPSAHRKMHVSSVGRHLQADALLFANVRGADAVTELAGTLLRATDGRRLWSGCFSGRERECVSVASELAAQLARAVGASEALAMDLPVSNDAVTTATA
jgi:serine/threonine-protein kinase